NVGSSDDAAEALVRRASDPDNRVHIITVGVGEYKQPVRIRIEPLRAPSLLRPDSGTFHVRVPVFGEGLPDEEFKVELYAIRIKDKSGNALIKDRKSYQFTAKDLVKVKTKTKGGQEEIKTFKTGKFKGEGLFPFDEVVFEVNLEEHTGIKAKEDPKGNLQGTWEFVARVARHKNEAFPKEFHENELP